MKIILGIIVIFVLLIGSYACKKPGYSVRGGNAYFTSKQSGWMISQKIAGVDSETFQIINKRYAKDKDRVYYSGTPLKGCNPEKLEILGGQTYFCKDDQYVFAGRTLISNDAPNFKFVKNSSYCKDSKQVFYLSWLVKGADVNSFEAVEGGIHMGKDKNQVYYHYEVLAQANPNTIQTLNYHYAKDAKHVFSERQIIANADADSFEVMSNYFGKDKNQVFYRQIPVKGADPQTSVHVEDLYFKDHKNVFHKQNLIPGADPNTFEVVRDGLLYGQDKNGRYYGGQPVEKKAS